MNQKVAKCTRSDDHTRVKGDRQSLDTKPGKHVPNALHASGKRKDSSCVKQNRSERGACSCPTSAEGMLFLENLAANQRLSCYHSWIYDFDLQTRKPFCGATTPPMEERELSRNDPCHCGSGKKYKRCHLQDDLNSGRRFIYTGFPIEPLTDVDSLRKNTLDFIDCLKGDLGISFNKTKQTGIVAGDISDGAIKRTYGRMPYFFPHDAPYDRICSSISQRQVSGFYWGSSDVNQIASHLLRYALYTPHIIISNPFCDMMRYHMDASPLEKPGAWRQLVVNKAIFLVSMEEWIREGIVIVLPPLKWTNWDLFNSEIKAVSQRRFDGMSKDQHQEAMAHSLMDFARGMHPDDLGWFIETYMKDAPNELKMLVRTLAKESFTSNPIRYQWAKSAEPQIIGTGTGNTLESAVFTSSLTGSYLLFGEDHFRRQYKSAQQTNVVEKTDDLTLLSSAFGQLEFTFLNAVELKFALELRQDGKLSRMRKYLHELWCQVSSVSGIERLSVDAAFRDELEDQYQEYKREWREIQKSIMRNTIVGVAEAGLATLSGNLQFSVAAAGLAAFSLKELMGKYTDRKSHERLPLGIFYELEKRSVRRDDNQK